MQYYFLPQNAVLTFTAFCGIIFVENNDVVFMMKQKKPAK